MKTSELKNLIHESVENVDDPDTLLLVRQILERKYSPAPIRLSAAQTAALDIAERQSANGEFLTNEEADSMAEKWLNE